VSDRPVPFDNLDFFLRFAEEWDTGITLDTAHVTSLGWDLLETVYRCNRRLTHVHLSDALDRNFRFALANALLRDHRLPGTGCLPLTELLAVLQRSGYHGHLTLELSPFAVLAVRERTVIERLAAAIRSVRQALDRSSDRSPSPKHSSSPEAN
jgi:sugar phosphate isomerase/epimerase